MELNFWEKAAVCAAVLHVLVAAINNCSPTMAGLRQKITRAKYVRRWHQTTASLVHAVVCALYSVPMLWTYSTTRKDDRFESVRVHAYGCPVTDSAPGKWFCEEWMMSLFAGYLISDFGIDIFESTMGYRAWEMDGIAHHTIFLLIGGLNYQLGRWTYMFYALVLGETSTIFLNIRWMMIATDETTRIGLVSALFASSFFCCRVLVYGYCLWTTFTEDSKVFADMSGWQVAPMATVLGYGLNLFWLRSIILNAISRRGPKDPSKAKGGRILSKTAQREPAGKRE